MFSFKNKLSVNLNHSLKNNEFKNYRVLIHYKNLQKKVENKIKSYKGTLIHSIPSINTICAIIAPYAINRLIEHPEIDFITFDTFAFICANNSITSANKVFLKGNYKLTGKGVGIGVIDTGVYPHPDLLKPYNKIKQFKDLINDFKYPYDDNGHGTFICGLLCGSGINSENSIRGIAENSHVYCIKAFNKLGKAFVSDILFAIQMLIDESEKYNIKILCLPFEIVDYNFFVNSLFLDIFDLAINKGILPIVPAGHNGNTQFSIRGISTLTNCIAVGGIDTTTYIPKPYEFSSGGPCKNIQKPDIVAACVNIESLNSDTNYISERNGMKIYPKHIENLYTSYTGTSCASAYICGLCALLLENNPTLQFKDVLSLLKVSCNLLNMPKYIQGSGTIDVDKLLP